MKMNYVSLDGGGTKLNAIWFDENLRLLGSAKARGVNATITPRQEFMQQIEECMDRLFDGHAPGTLDCLYVAGGNPADFQEVLEKKTRILSIASIGECVGGLLAGRCTDKGVLVISGTGSDAFLVDEGVYDVVGGWGAILGDEGSGVWIVRQAVQSAIQYEGGWGKPTTVGQLIREHLGFDTLFELVDYLYQSSAPFQKLGTLLPLMATAARTGDEAAIEAFHRGADALALQALSVLKRNGDPMHEVITCGGAWKAWPGMFERFKHKMQEGKPGVQVHLPWFEHVMAGPVRMLLDQDMDKTEIRDRLLAAFPQYEWRASK